MFTVLCFHTVYAYAPFMSFLLNQVAVPRIPGTLRIKYIKQCGALYYRVRYLLPRVFYYRRLYYRTCLYYRRLYYRTCLYYCVRYYYRVCYYYCVRYYYRVCYYRTEPSYGVLPH